MPRNRPKKQKSALIVQPWCLPDTSTGHCRPDGYSLHVSMNARDAFVRAICGDPAAGGPVSPIQPDGAPYKANVDAATYKKVQATEHGKRYFGDPPKPL